MPIQLKLISHLGIFSTLLTIPLFGCHYIGGSEGIVDKPPAVLRPHNQQAKVIEISVARDTFVGAVSNYDNMSRVRLIEVVASEEVGRSEYPEYRLFSITPKSAYSLLGFEEGDVLVSVNDYALNQPDRFRSYVQVVHLERGEVFAEIRRAGQPTILKWKFSAL